MQHVTVSFLCGLRGYHEYRTIWTPVLHEIIPVIHEQDNPYDRHAIAARKLLPGSITESTVGHLPKEISRITRYIMIHTAEVKLKIVDVNYRRSPLIRGGLEIPVEVIVKMVNNCKNKEAVTKYTELVKQKYKEPVDGKYEDISATVLASESDDDDDEESDDEIELPPP